MAGFFARCVLFKICLNNDAVAHIVLQKVGKVGGIQGQFPVHLKGNAVAKGDVHQRDGHALFHRDGRSANVGEVNHPEKVYGSFVGF